MPYMMQISALHTHHRSGTQLSPTLPPQSLPLTLLCKLIRELLGDTAHSVEVVLLHMHHPRHRCADAALAGDRVVHIDRVWYGLPQLLQPPACVLNLGLEDLPAAVLHQELGHNLVELL